MSTPTSCRPSQASWLKSRNRGQYCQAHGLLLQSYADLVQYIDTMINGVIASLWMLLGLGCVIATMGLVNTLTMNILEQTREIGMLRTVAMTVR